MKSETSIKNNYLYNVVYQLLLIIVPLVTAPYISRKLGPSMIGIQSYCYSIATYFLLFIMLGVANYGNRSVALIRDDRQKLSKVFWTIYGLQFLQGVVICAAYILYILLFAKEYYKIALINGLYVFSGLLDISWLFFGLEQFKITVTRNIIIKLINAACIFIFIKEPGDLWVYSLIIVMVAVTSNGYLWFYIQRFVDWYRPKLSEIKPHIKPELILFLPVIAVSFYNIMDRIMLGIFSNTEQVGYYTCAESVISIPMSLITALGTVMLPRISHLIASGDIEKGKQYIEPSMIFVIMMSSAMAFGLSAIAPTFAPTFFGNKFIACSPLIIGLSIIIFFISWANVIRTQYLIPNRKDTSYLISVVSGACVNLFVNVLLIPKMEAIGAVIGTICAEMTVCFLQTFMVRMDLPISRYLKENAGFIAIGLVMFFSVRFVGKLIENQIVSLIIQIAIGTFVYCALVLLLLWKSRNPIYISIKNSIIGAIKKH